MNNLPIVYHYTTPKSYKGMKTGERYGLRGIRPVSLFIDQIGGLNLPDEAHESVVSTLLDPLPDSWINNREFPGIWGSLAYHLVREDRLVLLSFRLLPSDKAYVVEEAHLFRNKGKSEEAIKKKWTDYWESRITIKKYDGKYSLPSVAIWNPIKLGRIRLETISSHYHEFRRILKNKQEHGDPRVI